MCYYLRPKNLAINVAPFPGNVFTQCYRYTHCDIYVILLYTDHIVMKLNFYYFHDKCPSGDEYLSFCFKMWKFYTSHIVSASEAQTFLPVH